MSERNGRITRTVNWLRILQGEVADRPRAERRQVLAREIGKATQGMVSEEREAFLDSLSDHFPTWGEVIVEQPPDPEAPPKGAWNDPGELVRRLQQLSESSEENRRRVQELLRSHDLAGQMPDPQAAEIKQIMGLPAQAQLHPARVLEVLRALLELAAWSEKLTREVWQKNGRSAELLGQRKLIEAAARLLTLEDRDAARQIARTELDELKEKTARRLHQIHALFKNLSEDLADRLAPEQIERVARGLFKHRKAWQRYIELCEGRDRVQFQTMIADQLKGTLDKIVRASKA